MTDRNPVNAPWTISQISQLFCDEFIVLWFTGSANLVMITVKSLIEDAPKRAIKLSITQM